MTEQDILRVLIFSFTQLRSKARWNFWLKNLRGHTIRFWTDQWLGDQPLVELANLTSQKKLKEDAL